jgi:hypothetical protein
MPSDCTIPEGAVLPGELRCTGLYAEESETELGCGVQEYKPAFELWSDGAAKRRFVWLPPGETIDVSQPDDFRFPVGTKFWKEFRVGSSGAPQKLGETRYLEKTELGWLYTSYVWDAEAQHATQINEGVEDLFGTGHSVPTREQCKTCHAGRKDYVLGWDFILLGPGAEGVTRETLAAEERLKDFGSQELEALPEIPGDAIEQAALSYLHVNCGVSCHNNNTNAASRPSGLFLRLELDELTSPQTTDAVTSGVNRTMTPNANVTDLTLPPGGFYEFRPLDLSRSLSFARMDFRGTPTAMPPLGTHLKDPQGIASVAAWINSMTVERGYPAPGP